MSVRTFTNWFLIILACAALGYVGYDIYSRYVTYSAVIQADNERSFQISINRSKTRHALKAVGVDSQTTIQGFWYTSTDVYGNQSVFFFNPDVWAMQDNLTSADIQALARVVASSTIANRDAMHEVAATDLPPALQFHNQIYNNQTPGAFQATQSSLEAAYKNGTASSDELWQLSYLYELQGDYAKRDELNAANCKLYKVRCAATIPITVQGTVSDLSGRPLQGASVSVLSHPEITAVTTDAKGHYSVALSAQPMEKVRVSAVKRNFSAGVASVLVLAAGKKVYESGTIVLGSPITIVTVDTVHHTVTDPADVARPDGSLVLHATSSTYEIPAGAIVNAKGKPYEGAVDVYIYEFTRDTVPQNLITLDTFDQVMGYAGDLMQSYGMPYIQFFAQDGTELDVRKSHPMLLTYRIPSMQVLRDNADNNPAGKLTDADMQHLVDSSAGHADFPITREFLVRNHLYTFPPFWVLDRLKGVWENQGIRVLDTVGTIQVPFYTINDTN